MRAASIWLRRFSDPPSSRRLHRLRIDLPRAARPDLRPAAAMKLTRRRHQIAGRRALGRALRAQARENRRTDGVEHRARDGLIGAAAAKRLGRRETVARRLDLALLPRDVGRLLEAVRADLAGVRVEDPRLRIRDR